MWIIKHQQEFWFLWVKLRRGRAEFPVCISATTPAECDCEHRAASCLCPQITLWGRIHVVGNSVPLLREKSPAGCLLCCTVRLTSKAGWKKFCGVEVYLMARLTNLLHLFIFLISLLATAVVTDDCRGLGGGILEFVDSAGGFWSKLIGFFQFMWVQLAVMPTARAAQLVRRAWKLYCPCPLLYLFIFQCFHVAVWRSSICLHLCRDQSLRPLLY